MKKDRALILGLIDILKYYRDNGEKFFKNISKNKTLFNWSLNSIIQEIQNDWNYEDILVHWIIFCNKYQSDSNILTSTIDTMIKISKSNCEFKHKSLTSKDFSKLYNKIDTNDKNDKDSENFKNYILSNIVDKNETHI